MPAPLDHPVDIMMALTLRKASMFSGLSEQSLELIVRGCRLTTVERQAYVFREGEPPAGFFVVHSGAINVHRVTADGREQVIRIFYPGETFGEVGLIEGDGYPASAIAIERSQVIVIDRRFFRDQIHRDPDLALRILASMSVHLRFLVETVEDLKLQQAEARVAQWLTRQAQEAPHAEAKPQVITIPMAKRLLASQLGITSETFSRVLAHLRKEAIIEVDGKEITLLKPQQIAAMH